jgi:peptidylprolyl isomerase
VWGRVIEGMENVDKLKRGEPPMKPDKMISVRVASDAAA